MEYPEYRLGDKYVQATASVPYARCLFPSPSDESFPDNLDRIAQQPLHSAH